MKAIRETILVTGCLLIITGIAGWSWQAAAIAAGSILFCGAIYALRKQ